MSKKKVGTSSSAAPAAATPDNVQTAAERRAAEAELRMLIEKYAPEHTRLIAALRKALLKRLPTAHEVVYEYGGFFVLSYSPSGHGYEGVLALRASADGIQLYFNQGKDLPDPTKLLKGSAKLVRFIDVERVSTLARPEVASLIDAAIARNPVPFAAEGRGPITIRLTTAKKRNRTT